MTDKPELAYFLQEEMERLWGPPNLEEDKKRREGMQELAHYLKAIGVIPDGSCLVDNPALEKLLRNKEMNIQTGHHLTSTNITHLEKFKEFLQDKVIERIELLESTMTLECSHTTDYTLILDIIKDCKEYITQIDALLGDK